MQIGTILFYCHIASVSESFSYIHYFGSLIQVTPKALRLQNPSLTPASIADLLRERLHPGAISSVHAIISQELPYFSPDFFAFDGRS